MAKNFDYKVTINFEMSGHNCPKYQTDKIIKENALEMLKHYFNKVKNPGCVKIERNYTRKKWSMDRLKKRKVSNGRH